MPRSMRERNSAVERAAAAHVDPLAAPNGSAPQGAARVPSLPEQCTQCQRWVDRARLAVMPIGASPWCSICAALDELRGAVKESQLSLAQEEQVLDTLFQAHVLLRRRQDREASHSTW